MCLMSAEGSWSATPMRLVQLQQGTQIFLQIIKIFVIIIIESERKIIPCSLVVKHAAVNR